MASSPKYSPLERALVAILLCIVLISAGILIPEIGLSMLSMLSMMNVQYLQTPLAIGLIGLLGIVAILLALWKIRGIKNTQRENAYLEGEDIAIPDFVDKEQTIKGKSTQVLMSPEMQFALNAAFEKLKQSREELERQVAERTQELRDSLQVSTDIVASIPSALFIFEFQPPDLFTLVTANPEASRIVGIDTLELTGSDVREILPQIQRKNLFANIIEVMWNGKTLNTEYQEYDDSEIAKAYHLCAFKMPNNRLGITLEDITERKRTETALSRERNRAQQYLDITDAIIVALDRDGCVTMINKAGCRVLGRQRDEIIGNDWFDLCLPPQSKDEARELFRQYISGRTEPPDTYRQTLFSKDNREITVIWRSTCLTDALGQITGLFCSGEDITDKDQTEQIHQDNENRLRAIIDDMPAGVLVVDSETKTIVDTNPAIISMIGESREQIIGRSISEFVKPDTENRSGNDNQCQLNTATGKSIPVIKTSATCELQGKQYQIANIIDISKRIEIENALIQSEEQFRKLFEKANEGILIGQGEIIPFCNPKVVEISGYSAEELASMPFRKILHPDDLDMVYKTYQRRLAGEETPSVYTARIIHKSGETRWIEIRGMGIEWLGKPAVLNFLSDITERKQVEEVLQRNLIAMETTSEGMAILDDKGKYVYLNKAHARIYGYESPEELLGQSWQVLYEPDELEHFQNEIMPQFEKNGFWKGEAVGRKKDGSTFPQEVSLTALEDGGLVCVVCDISERKKALHILRESEMRFRSVIESVPNIAVQGYNSAKEVIFWNKASEMLYGYTEEEALGKKLYDLILPDQDHFSSSEQDGTIKVPLGPGEIAMKHKDGSIVPVYSSHVTLKSIQGEPELYCLDVDLTALKRAQEQQAILQEQLERAQRMESLGILAGGVAHDLNNMLGPIVGYSDLLLLKTEPENPQRKQIQRIGKAAQDAANIVQDLLTLARRGRYEMTPMNLNAVIKDYFDSPSFLQLVDNRQDVKLHLSLDNNIPLIMGSSPHLVKVIMNLIINSYDAMPDGGELSVTTSCETLETLLGGYRQIVQGEYVLLRIKDTGTGISEEDLGSIFEPYYSKKQMGSSGSGLGLAVVYGIVKDHKGYYDVFSVPGEGTEFVLYFPKTTQKIAAINSEQANLKGSESVLIIDDNKEQRQITSDILRMLGYEVHTAKNGHEAVAYLSEHTVDILVVDMIMEQGYDGLDTYRDILAIHPQQKAIIISGFSATERVNEMRKMGAGAYIIKPFTVETIGRALRNELDRVNQTASVK